MNALAMAPYAVIALAVIFFIYWIYRRGKAEGASQEKVNTNRKVDKVANKYIKRAYDGVIGSRAFRVLKPGKWKPRIKP